MKRDKAISNIQVDNKLVRITKFSFQPGEETRMHKHLYDYIVTPITNGKMLLIDRNGNKSNYTMLSSESYFRKAGIEHNVINNGKEKLIFIETELKNIKSED
jgi:quercetin dioxygenase-like cupin family protein